jgi:HK97 family phage prohead protease
VSYLIVDIDGTLTTTGNTPRTDFIDYLKSEAADGKEIIIVSARPISRLAETRDWLNANNVPHAQVHLNDFSTTPGPNVGLEFKKYKYGLLIKQYGLDQIDEVIDNDPDVRAMAKSLGLQAETPQAAMADYMPNENNAARQLTDRQEAMVEEYISIANDYGPFDQGSGPNGAHYASGDLNPFKQDGLVCGHCRFYQPGTEAEGRCAIVAGPIDPNGICKLWVIEAEEIGVPLTEVPLAAPVVEDPMQMNSLTVDSTEDRSEMDDVAEVIDLKEKEIRSVPIGEFRLAEAGADGQRTFTGYASIWNSASAGPPFEEKIAPNAFKRSLSRAAAGQKIIAFLFGHDETRALATTASGRLILTEDATGLRVEAKLDPADPDAAKVISMLTHESAAAGMSFGFQKVQDAWDGNNRTIKEANLFEVSILAAGGQTPAYPATLGLTAIRQVTAPKIGVDAEALLATLESVKAGRELSTEEVAVIDAVRSKLAPKPEGIDPSIAAALLAISAAEGDAL